MTSFLRRAVRWGIVAIALIALYVLSVGPAVWIHRKTGVEKGVYLEVIYAPLIWLHANTPLKDGLEGYVRFFDEMD